MVVGRVLSIQSHVAHGYVGNRAAVFPLQLLDFEVDFINSVQFSNHVGYKHLKGDRFNSNQLNEIYNGLKLNNLTQSYTHLLTGYSGDESFLNKIADIVDDLKANNPNLIYLCDPVLGDNGHWYVPVQLLDIFKKRLLVKADIITPNIFELEKIYGKDINSTNDIIDAISYCHDEFGIKKVILSSCRSFDKDKPNKLNLFASSIDDRAHLIKIEFDSLPGSYCGTGDTFAAMLLAWLAKFNDNLEKACEYSTSAMQHILLRTYQSMQDPALKAEKSAAELQELKIIESKRDIEDPKVIVRSELIALNSK